MKVSELASRLSVTPDTVRYYTRIKLLSPRIDPSNGYKSYSHGDLTRLKFIQSCRHLGFSVADITQLLNEADRHESPCPTAYCLFVQNKLCVNNQNGVLLYCFNDTFSTEIFKY